MSALPPNPPGGKRPEYAAAQSWAQDINEGLRSSRRMAWRIAIGAGVIAVLEAIALAALAPIKTVIPYTILVDRQTGYVETIQPLKPGALSQDAAVAQSMLVQYVLARETFDATDLRDNYRKVQLWSAPDARGEYVRQMDRSNPTSPVAVNAPTSLVTVSIKSVSLLTPTTALVRFDTQRRDAGAAIGEIRSYTAALAFRFTGAPMRMEDRFVNPLGFQVTRYRRDDEAGVTAPARAAPVPSVVPTPVPAPVAPTASPVMAPATPARP